MRAHRAYFDQDTAKIVNNLDHRALEEALAVDGGNVEGTAFRRLSYEAAFTENALALARLECARNPEIDGDEVVYEVRDALRRISQRAVSLYTV